MTKNKPVILYGAGFRGGRNFLALAEENVHVEAFCDRDAKNIPLYYGCEVYSPEEAIKRYPAYPFIVCIDQEPARDQVLMELKERKIEAYNSFEEFFQGKKDAEVKTVRCGTTAVFQIIPELLGKWNQVAFSFGIGYDFSFEVELAERYHMKVYAFDPSQEVIDTMSRQQLPDHVQYYPYGLSDMDGIKEFFMPSSGQDYSEYFAPWTNGKTVSMQVYRLKTLMNQLQIRHLDLLKMDIEGSEFMALPEILASGVEFDQLCIETHARIFPNSVEKMREIRCLLNRHGYLLVSNGREEQTYIKESLIKIPKVSIIMPSLNVSDYIDECILSAFNQTLKEIEIICIDAGSTDGTWEILQKYAGSHAYDTPLKVLRSERKSYGYQVNLGIKEAKGEYIAILETDDYIEDNMYQSLYEIAVQHDADVVKADYDRFMTLSSGKRYFERIELWVNHRDNYNRIICPQNNTYLYANDYNIWKGIYRRKMLNDNQIWLNESPGAAYQDIGFAEQVLSCAKRAYYIDESYYRYRMDRDTSSVNSVHGLKYSYQEFKRILETPDLYQKIGCKEGLYYHMAQAFLGEYRKTLIAVNYEMESEYLSLYYDWFYDKLVKYWEEGSLPFEQMGEYLVSQLKLLIFDRRQFCQDVKKAEDQKQQMKEEILQSLKTMESHNVYIFGAGRYGISAIKFLRINNMEPEGVCDNQESLWGNQIDGISILSPRQCAETLSNQGGIILIANKMNRKDIYCQLLDMGVPEQQILYYKV